MSSQPEERSVVVLRRRRTSRHRRNRRIRRAVLIAFCAVAVLSFSSVGLRYLTPSLRSALQRVDLNLSERSAQKTLQSVRQESANEMSRRPVYPYSVVSGGVRSAGELKSAAANDSVVALHYAGFDFSRAHLVRLLGERSVYLSYRIGNRVYWTRHRVKLHKGETLLTDGKMTARARCANRVEEQPQQESSQLEPPAAKFDEPIMPAIGTALETPPVPFETSLNRAALSPAAPLGSYDPISGGNWTPIAPPPLPNVCGIDGPKKGAKGGASTGTGGNGKNKNIDMCAGSSTSEVPEPGTWLLVASGMAALMWMARQKFARV